MHRRLRELHETVASSFDEVKAQCLPFPNKGAMVEEMIDWVVGEVKAVPDIVWWLSDNFTVLGIEGVLNILTVKDVRSCIGFATWLLPVTLLSWKMFSRTCIGWWSRLCRGGGNHMACLRLFIGLRQPTSRL
jgi:hypothetical protein